MSKACCGVGNWALGAERTEAEELERAAADAASSSATILAGEPAQNFPSLKRPPPPNPRRRSPSPSPSPSSPPPMVMAAAAGNLFEPRGLTPDEMLNLPTRPRQHSHEKLEYGRLSPLRLPSSRHSSSPPAAPPPLFSRHSSPPVATLPPLPLSLSPVGDHLQSPHTRLLKFCPWSMDVALVGTISPSKI